VVSRKWLNFNILCRSGGIGRRTGLKTVLQGKLTRSIDIPTEARMNDTPNRVGFILHGKEFFLWQEVGSL